MEKLYYEEPSLRRKQEAIEYIEEHQKYNSKINGVGGLDRYINDYEGWLKKLEEDYNRKPTEEKVPARTYYLIRKSDDKIIGMINIRLILNEKLKKYGGNIGYGIRPTERRKGYNKINLYLGLKVCQKYNIKQVLLDADIENIGSWKTMEALGGKRIREYYDDEYAKCTVVDYIIDVEKSLEKYKEIYEQKIEKKLKK